MRSPAISLFFALLAPGCGDEAPPVARAGVVREATGVGGVHAGARCDVAITPESRGGFDCRVTLICEGITLVGGAALGGYADCEVSQGQYVTAADLRPSTKDGDPSVRVDLPRGEVVFEDQGPARRVVVALDRP